MANTILKTKKPLPSKEVRKKLEPYIGKFVSYIIEYDFISAERAGGGGYLKKFGKNIGLEKIQGVAGIHPEKLEKERSINRIAITHFNNIKTIKII